MIDWSLIAESVDFYRGRGYVYVEVPWIVSKKAVDITMPTDGSGRHLSVSGYDNHPGGNSDHLVASAEQSFLQIMMRGTMPTLGRYVAVTPCFRRESAYSADRLPYFMKVELIDFSGKWQSVLDDAYAFFSRKINCRIEPTDNNSADIVSRSHSIELGSYGKRSYVDDEYDMSWSYGTGIAEPRFTQTRKILEND